MSNITFVISFISHLGAEKMIVLIADSKAKSFTLL